MNTIGSEEQVRSFLSFALAQCLFKGLDGGMGFWRLFTLSSVAFGMHISGLGAIAHCLFSSRLRLFCFSVAGGGNWGISGRMPVDNRKVSARHWVFLCASADHFSWTGWVKGKACRCISTRRDGAFGDREGERVGACFSFSYSPFFQGRGKRGQKGA